MKLKEIRFKRAIVVLLAIGYTALFILSMFIYFSHHRSTPNIPHIPQSVIVQEIINWAPIILPGVFLGFKLGATRWEQAGLIVLWLIHAVITQYAMVILLLGGVLDGLVR